VKRLSILVVAGFGVLAFCLGPSLLLAAALAQGDGQSGPTVRAEREIPAALLGRYQRSPACSGLPWQVVAAVGYVESRHGTVGGAHLDPVTGMVTPAIVGIALDGTGSAAVRVPVGGSPWHHDPVWDHAVGPMQFTTATWSDWGVDASGDGLASPHNAFDAIATAGRYLCAGRPELANKDDVERAVRRYNNSAAYVRAVLEKAFDYGMTDGGDAVLGLLTAARAPIGLGPQIAGSAAPVVAYALAQVGDPYVWGAAGPNAFDCSGLVMAAYRQIGIQLPHRSDLQVRYGQAIDWRAHPVQAGDLIFLRGGSPVHDYGHVGIAVDSDRWVVAPRTGEDVHVGSIPFSRVQAVRRIVTQK
jgi:hypothetical protein